MKADSKKLIDMVNRGMTATEIRKALGIKPKAPLRRMYYDALVKAGRIRDIVSERRVRKRPRKRRTLAIGKGGTILLSKPLLVNQLGFKEGDKFSVTKRRDRIVLKRAG